MNPDKFLTITELAACLRVTERVIKRHIKAGTIPCGKIGKAIRFRWGDVKPWWDALTEKHPAKFRQIRTTPKGISQGSAGTPEPVVALVKGAKGRNRQRLVEG